MVRNNLFIDILTFCSIIILASCDTPGRKPEGQLDENGQKTGLWIEYYDDGSVLRKSNYKDGEKHGADTTYHKNGRINSIAEYYTGFLNGKWIKWHENGDLDEEGNYFAGKSEGQWTYYYYTGNKKRQVGFYKQSIRDSTWIDYFENGNILSQLLYRNGKIVPKEAPQN